MKCYTNESNPATLKLLIAANFGQVPVELEFVNAKGLFLCFLVILIAGSEKHTNHM